jgi:hypothetical protein
MVIICRPKWPKSEPFGRSLRKGSGAGLEGTYFSNLGVFDSGQYKFYNQGELCKN